MQLSIAQDPLEQKAVESPRKSLETSRMTKTAKRALEIKKLRKNREEQKQIANIKLAASRQKDAVAKK